MPKLVSLCNLVEQPDGRGDKRQREVRPQAPVVRLGEPGEAQLEGVVGDQLHHVVPDQLTAPFRRHDGEVYPGSPVFKQL